jgi:hypothetical protein
MNIGLKRRLGARRTPDPIIAHHRALVRALPSAAVPPDPPSPSGLYPPADYIAAVKDWEDLGNTVCGDCVPAALCHLAQARAAANGRVLRPTSAEAMALYKQVNPGWELQAPETDTGSDPGTVLRLLASQGAVIGGASRQIAGVAAIAPSDLAGLQYALAHAGGVLAVVALPLDAETQTRWSLTVPSWRPGVALSGSAAPESWGLHAIPLLAHDAQGWRTVSWGEIIPIDPEWLLAYLVEAWMLAWDTSVDRPGPGYHNLLGDIAWLGSR